MHCYRGPRANRAEEGCRGDGEMNNIIGALNEKASQLNTLMRATEPKLVTMYMPFKKAVYESKIPVESTSDTMGAPQ